MNPTDFLLPVALCSSQYFAIDELALSSALMKMVSAAKQRQLDTPVTRADPMARTTHKYQVDATGIANFDLTGIILDQPDSFLDYIGYDYTVTPHFATAISDALARSDVKGIAINADTPGGSVVGLQAAYETIRDAKKPVTVAVTGMLASAGVYLTAAADRIIAEPAAIIGSIGTMTTITDMSEMAARLGIKVHLIASGPQKGTGTTGVPVTADRLKPMQAIVDELATQFRAVVAEGRGLTTEAVAALATGEAWIAGRALTLGLIDQISTNPTTAATTGIKDLTMLDKNQYKALINAHPQHLALIDKLDAEGADEATVKAALITAHTESLTAANADLSEKLETAKKEHADAVAAIAAEKAAAATAKTQHDAKVAELENKIKAAGLTIPTYQDPKQHNLSSSVQKITRKEYLSNQSHYQPLLVKKQIVIVDNIDE